MSFPKIRVIRRIADSEPRGSIVRLYIPNFKSDEPNNIYVTEINEDQFEELKQAVNELELV